MALGRMQAPDSDRLFVTKIPQAATKEDVHEYFTRFGSITDVYLPAVPGVPGHKGIAFISFGDGTSVQLAMNSGPHELRGHEVVVDIAAPRGVPPHGQVAMMQPTMEGLLEQQAAADRLFVTKVPPSIQREHLREHFSQFGDLTDVYMPAVPGGNTHKGICFVSFSDPASLHLALQHSPHEVHGHQVVVDVAAPRGLVPGRGVVAGATTGPGGPSILQAQGTTVAGIAMQQQQAATMAMPGTMMQGYATNMMAPGMSLAPNTGSPVPGRLFVTRVPPDLTKVDLQLYFQQFGQLDDVYIPTGGKGIAFVSFRDSTVSQRVLQTQQHFVKPGKPVLVDQALDRPPLAGKGGGACAVATAAAIQNAALYGAYGGSTMPFNNNAWGTPRPMQPVRYMPY